MLTKKIRFFFSFLFSLTLNIEKQKKNKEKFERQHRKIENICVLKMTLINLKHILTIARKRMDLILQNFLKVIFILISLILFFVSIDSGICLLIDENIKASFLFD